MQKKKLKNLHGIVIALATAVMTGMVSGYLLGILSEDLFLACGVGVIIGFMIGFMAGQPIGIMPILVGSITGFMSGIIGAILGVSIKTENPFLFLIILLVFYIIVLGFVILFVRVEANEKLMLDTQAISPFVILSAAIVLLSSFLFLYSSDIIKVSDTAATAQAQAKEAGNNTTNAGNSNSSGSPASVTEVDATKESASKIKMEVTPTGYSPNLILVKKGVPVEIEVHNPLENSCLSTFNMPDFNINNVNLKVGTTTLTFTPSNTGEYTFSCGMNMYGGKVIVK
jgi:heme/copper-type cytochrome/quinol oxidase subunit 2